MVEEARAKAMETFPKKIGKETKTVPIPPEEFNDVPSPTPKRKHVARKRLLLKDRLRLCAEPIEPAPHIGHAGCDPDLRPGRNLDRKRSEAPS